VKLNEEKITVAQGIKDRGTSVRQLAKQLGMTEGALRYRLAQAKHPTPDGRANQATALDGYEEAVVAIQERLQDGRLREAWEVERALLQPVSSMADPFDVVVSRKVQRDCLVLFEGRR